MITHTISPHRTRQRVDGKRTNRTKNFIVCIVDEFAQNHPRIMYSSQIWYADRIQWQTKQLRYFSPAIQIFGQQFTKWITLFLVSFLVSLFELYLLNISYLLSRWTLRGKQHIHLYINIPLFIHQLSKKWSNRSFFKLMVWNRR